MGIFKDLTGQKFSRLTVVSQNPVRSLSGNVRWNCVCDCGNKATVRGSCLMNGATTSCGCYNKERSSEISKKNHATHGMSGTPEYNCWCRIIQRCTNADNPDYTDYGARGITVCDRWLNSFEAFYEDMGPRPSLDHSIDRKDNNLGYYKENCRWATDIEQNNNRRNSAYHPYRGKQYTVSQLVRLPEAIENGICVGTLYTRINQLRWSAEQAMSTPTRESLSYTRNGVVKTISELAKEYGIEYDKLYNRLIILKWDFERAVSIK